MDTTSVCKCSARCCLCMSCVCVCADFLSVVFYELTGVNCQTCSLNAFFSECDFLHVIAKAEVEVWMQPVNFSYELMLQRSFPLFASHL